MRGVEAGDVLGRKRDVDEHSALARAVEHELQTREAVGVERAVGAHQFPRGPEPHAVEPGVAQELQIAGDVERVHPIEVSDERQEAARAVDRELIAVNRQALSGRARRQEEDGGARDEQQSGQPAADSHAFDLCKAAAHRSRSAAAADRVICGSNRRSTCH